MSSTNIFVSPLPASAIDSRFEFRSGEPIRYALLLGKSFPTLRAFTIAFWINITHPRHAGTILSYKHGAHVNWLRIMSGPTLNFQILGHRKNTDIELKREIWYHIALTWNSASKDLLSLPLIFLCLFLCYILDFHNYTHLILCYIYH